MGRRHWALFVSSFQVDAFAYELGILPEVIRMYLPLDCFSSGQGGSDYVFRVTSGFEKLVGPELYVVAIASMPTTGTLSATVVQP